MARLSRRQMIRNVLLGTAGGGLIAGGARAEEPGRQPAASTQTAGSCRLMPQQVEGPYYFDPDMVRQDITGGREGKRMKLVLKVIEHPSCTPIEKARVDVWHCDARGVYSGYGSQGDDRSVSARGETYLRGTQFTDATGAATFQTIYPGWYPGRTPHIHIKVFLDKATVLTSQAYFPDALSERIYTSVKPYVARDKADTKNGADFIFNAAQREGGSIVMATDGGPGSDLEASLVMAVDRTSSGRAGWSIRDIFGG